MELKVSFTPKPLHPPCSLSCLHHNENLMSEGNVSSFYIDLEGQLISLFESIDVWAGRH